MLHPVNSHDLPFLLFVYGRLLRGEPGHGLLEGSELVGPTRTAAQYSLFELSGFPALVRAGDMAVAGELYRISREIRLQLDLYQEHPRLFVRETICLEHGDPAESYLMRAEQVRMRRRLPNGDWRARFAPRATGIPESPWRRWARERSHR
jgi:gamma-glutamylcyclotransferase (GGCT)/AIG2-like uncharacterized protein YtfP